MFDKNLTHIWKPLLHEIAAGTLDSSEDELNYITHAYYHHFRFQLGEFTALDRKKQVIELTLSHIGKKIESGKLHLPYDLLIIAVGSVSNNYNIPGVNEYCYYLDDHRQYLLQGGKSHPCFTEFQSDPYVEQQADCFSAGLLMPSFLLAPHVNKQAEPTLEIIKNTAREFEVSITSMMVRWTLLSDFPCAIISISADGINWGWISEGFRRVKGYRVRRNEKVLSGDAQKFRIKDLDFSNYREGQGLGMAHQWIDFDLSHISVKEFYAVIPYTHQINSLKVLPVEGAECTIRLIFLSIHVSSWIKTASDTRVTFQCGRVALILSRIRCRVTFLLR